MGKSPGKWIKSVLFRKKTSNSSLQKKRDILPKKSSDEKESPTLHEAPVSNVVVQPCFISQPVLVTGAAGYENNEFESTKKFSYEKESSDPHQTPVSKTPVSNAVVQPCFISQPVHVTGAPGYQNNELESERAEVTGASNTEQTLTSPKEDDDAGASLNHDNSVESEKYRLEQAATKAQSIFRGYQARRAFWTLKAIIRLQAVVRGHLVRRQAVATLNCVLGIVKFQALVRGRMARNSDLCSQIHAKPALPKQDAGSLGSVAVYTYDRRDKLERNAFTRQLLSYTSSAMPVQIPYDPVEPNSAWNWLLRWTMSDVWGSRCERETVIVSKGQHKTQGPMSKVNLPKQPVNVDKTSSHSTSESGKVKRNLRQNEIGKGESNPKNLSNSESDIPHQAEVSTDKQRHSHKRSFNSLVPEMAENPPKNAAKVLLGVTPDPASEEKIMIQPVGEDLVKLGDHPIPDSPDKQLINGTQEEDLLTKEKHKINKRRASLPAVHDDPDTLQNGTKVPSYMAATKSAKAKVRGQSSPRFGQEEVDKNGSARRYSLPSSVNAKPTSSPRVQRLVQSSGKAGIRIDRSLSSSRDGNEKVVHPEWKR